MVNLTGLLVMSTMFNDSSYEWNSLFNKFQFFSLRKLIDCLLYFRVPKTGYTKMMDIWTILSLSLPFAIIILQSIIYILKQKCSNSNIIHGMDMRLKKVDNLMHDHKGIVKNKYQKISKIVEDIATYGLPFSYALFLICFFSYGILVWYFINICTSILQISIQNIRWNFNLSKKIVNVKKSIFLKPDVRIDCCLQKMSKHSPRP